MIVWKKLKKIVGGDVTQLSNFVDKNKCDVKIFTEPKSSICDSTCMDMAREKSKRKNVMRMLITLMNQAMNLSKSIYLGDNK